MLGCLGEPLQIQSMIFPLNENATWYVVNSQTFLQQSIVDHYDNLCAAPLLLPLKLCTRLCTSLNSGNISGRIINCVGGVGALFRTATNNCKREMVLPLLSSVASASTRQCLVAGRRRIRGGAVLGGAVPLHWRRCLSDAAANGPPFPPPPRAPGSTQMAGERAWTWSTPSPLRPGRGTAEIPIIPRYEYSSRSKSTTAVGSI